MPAGYPELTFKVVAEGLGLDKRIGPILPRSRPRVGGSCFPKDLRALKEFGKKVGVTPYILEAVERVNLEQALQGLGACGTACRRPTGEDGGLS
jgi:UDP-glucose 6-dehydrogenase